LEVQAAFDRAPAELRARLRWLMLGRAAVVG
jgi:hypothetical protein